MRVWLAIAFSAFFALPAWAQQAPAETPECAALRQWAQSARASLEEETIATAMERLSRYAQTCLADGVTMAPSANVLGLTAPAENVAGAHAFAGAVAAKFEVVRASQCRVSPSGVACALWQALRDRAAVLERVSPERADLDNMRVEAAVRQVVIGPGGSFEPAQPTLFLCAYLAGRPITSQSSCEDPAIGDVVCTSHCLDAFETAVAALPGFKALGAVAHVLTLGVREDIGRWSAENNARWRNYLFGGEGVEPQPLWEIALNSWAFGYTDAQRARLPEPRSRQIIALRPSVGAEVYEADGTELELAGVIEVLGYRQWRWGDNAARERQWGASAIAVYSPSEDADDWGYGVLIKTPWLDGIDVSIIGRQEDDGGDRVGVVFSTDISRIIPRTPAAAACGFFNLPGCTGEGQANGQ